jgi:hypothetical protein
MSFASLKSFFLTKKMMESYIVTTTKIFPKSISICETDSDSDSDSESDYVDSDKVIVDSDKVIIVDSDKVIVDSDKVIIVDSESIQKYDNKPILQLQKRKPLAFVPRKKDNLFWCFYVIVNGFSKYEYPGNNSFENEKTEKFRLIEFLRKQENRSILKKYKIKRDDTENDLANQERISPKTFLALCYTHNLNILFIHRYKCFKIHGGHPEDIYHVIHKYDPPHQNPHGLYKYAYDVDASAEDKAKYLDSNLFYEWETIDKPLKAISSYKVADLTRICQINKIIVKNEIEQKSKTKQEIYDLLIEKM